MLNSASAMVLGVLRRVFSVEAIQQARDAWDKEQPCSWGAPPG